MKKIYLAIAMLFAVFISHAQWNNNGNNSTTGDLTVRNPNNNNASMTLSWLDDIPRIRLGGTGNGSANGFEIQSIGNKKLFKVNQTADIFVYGKLGVGTTSPSEKLHIEAPKTSLVKIKSNSSTGQSGIILQGKRTNSSAYSSHYIGTDGESHYTLKVNADEDIKLQTNGLDKMIIKSNGNVGIGTTTPSQKLDIRGNVSSTGTLSLGSIASSNSLRDIISLYGNRLGETNMYGFGVEGDGTLYNKAVNNHRWYISKNADKGTSAKMELSNSRLFVSGNLGLGVKDTKGYKLAVAGSKGIIAEEVTVKLKSAWPDYVFANDYKLPTLKDVENHIKEKGHLANIPSAKEVKENGVKLGEMNTKLLEKVEELTLYTIQQEKKLEKQNNDIKELKALVKQLINTKK